MATIFGPDIDQIGQKIDNILGSLPEFQDDSSSDELTGKFIDAFLDTSLSKDINGSKSSDVEIDKLFENVSVPRERISRYTVYEEILKSVPLTKRILRVYLSNILQKNPVNGRIYLLKDVTDDKEKNSKIDTIRERFKKHTKQVLDKFDLITKLRKIITVSLLYGDCFVEIIDVNKESSKFSLKDLKIAESVNVNTLLTECERLSNEIKAYESVKTNGSFIADQYFDKLSELIIKPVDIFSEARRAKNNSQLVYTQNTSIGSSEEEHQQTTFTGLDNVLIKIHSPKNIIVLETDYGTRIGYLEILRDDISDNVTNLAQMFSVIVGRLTRITNDSLMTREKIIDKLIYHVIKKIASQTGIESSDIDSVIRNKDIDLYNFIKRLMIEQDSLYRKDSRISKLRVRFIPSSHMVSFTRPSTEYAPYGESVIDPLAFPCKLYILAQLSNVITKLSRAALIRTWNIDVGSLQMHSGLIQKLRRELYNTRVTLDDLGSFKSIPKILSDFKDMFIFSRAGQRALDVDVRSYGDPSIKIQDLEDTRREIIALSGIPAPYLGYQDVIELREQLAHINVAFATEITDLQEMVSDGLTKIIDIVANVSNFDVNDGETRQDADNLEVKEKPSDYIKVTLIPPIVLIVQLIEMTLNSVGSITSVFDNLKIKVDPYFFLKQYIPFIDWDAFKEASERYNAESSIKDEIGNAGGDMM